MYPGLVWLYLESREDTVDLGSFDNGSTGKGLLFVISSVSGGGKTTVIGRLLKIFGDLHLSVSHTTRKPRSGEENGRDYNFTSVDSFKGRIKMGQFLEWAEVYGHYYGTSKDTIDAITHQGCDALLDIDVQGAMQVKNRVSGAILIFILPPGEDEHERRLKDRGTESDLEISIRLEAARQELAFVKEYHYCVLNDDVKDAVDAVSSIIRAERCRVRSTGPRLNADNRR
jgi:guanylate kinase